VRIVLKKRTAIFSYRDWRENKSDRWNDVECTLLKCRCSLFLEEKRIAEGLTRYYGVKEILLPPRKL